MEAKILGMKEIVLHMKKLPLFRYFDDRTLADLLSAGKLQQFDENQVIIREGDVSSDLFIILSGAVNVSVTEETRDVFICVIGEGEIFGEAGIFSKVKRTASVVANQQTLLLRLNRKSFLMFLNRSPQTGMKLLMIMVFSLLKKLRAVNQELAFERKYDVDQEDIDSIIRDLMSGQE